MPLLSIIIGFLIITLELLRKKRVLSLDFGTGVSLAFLLIYSLAPLMLYTLGPASNQRFFWLGGIDYQDPSLGIPALLIGLIGYISVVLGYSLSKRAGLARGLARLTNASLKSVSRRSWLLLSLGLGVFAIFCLAIYVKERGAGLDTLLRYAGEIRWGISVPGAAEASYTFLNWAMLGIPAAFILLGLLLENRPEDSRIVASRFRGAFPLILLLLSLAAFSMLVLWIRAGRLHVVNFMLVILLVLLGRSRSQLVRLVLALGSVTGAIAFTLVGKFLFSAAKVISLPGTTAEYFQTLFLEFAFPFLSLVNVLSHHIVFRGFLDYFLGPLYLIGVPVYRVFAGVAPSVPESVAKVNTTLILGPVTRAQIPVDVSTLGYFSAGVTGVVLASLLVGVAVGWLELVFPPDSRGVIGVLRLAWIVFMSTIGVMYADPVNLLNDGFYVIAPTAIAVALGLMRTSRQVSRQVGLRGT